MELFLVLLGLGLCVAIVIYTKTYTVPTISIKPAITNEVEPQITDDATVIMSPEVVAFALEVTEPTEAPKKRGRKPKITAVTKKPVKGKKQVAPKPVRGRKKKS
jgi:hypothetical protein